MSDRPTKFELAEELADALWRIHEYRRRSNRDEDDLRDDVHELVLDVLDDLGAKGLDEVGDLLDPLEYVCLGVTDLWGWTEAVDELVEEIAEHLEDRRE